MKPERLPQEVLAALSKTRAIRIRAGTGDHRFIGIWFVLVEDRVFVRSWSVKPDGWYRAFLRDPKGTMRIGQREVAIRSVPIRSKRLRDAVDRAYLKRYCSAGAIKYARDLTMATSRATTLEFLPRQNPRPDREKS